MTTAEFTTTHWSVVLSAGNGDGEPARRAWEHLAERYWYPLYAFARRGGARPEDAADQTQSFFAHLLDSQSVARVSPQRGRFRTFLLAAFRHHLSNLRRDATTWKRGGRVIHVPLDPAAAEECYAQEPADPQNPEQLYERRWAMLILERSLERLGAEVVANAGAAFWDRVQHCVEGELDEAGYAAIARDSGRSEAAVRSAVRRLRVRLGELVRAELAPLVTNAADLDDELHHWAQVLRGA